MFQFHKSSIALCHLAISPTCTVWMLLQLLLPQEMCFFKKNMKKKTLVWHVSSCPGASGAPFPLVPALPPPTFLLPLPHLPVCD